MIAASIATFFFFSIFFVILSIISRRDNLVDCVAFAISSVGFAAVPAFCLLAATPSLAICVFAWIAWVLIGALSLFAAIGLLVQ